MSFTSDVKKELTTLPTGKKCCQLAQIAGFLRFAGSITLSGGGMGVRVSTDSPAVARLLITLIRDYFGTRSALSIEDSMQPLSKGRSYELSITPSMNADAILREVGIIGVREGSNYITDGLDPGIIKKRCCRKACLKGIFLAAGSVTDPARSYHLEISCASEYMAGDVRKLVNSFGLKAKVCMRRNRYIVYLKDGEQIADFLGIIGAANQLFKFENVRITKEMRSTANRINNCENANLQKSVNAAQRQIADIRYIKQARGLEFLPEKLRTAAQLRLENPELPLADLAVLFDPPLAKSGLNHRLARLSQIAEELRKKSLTTAGQ